MLLEPRIRPEISSRHFAEAILDEMVARYTEKGYKVAKNAKLGSHRADLVATKGKRLVVIEIKAGEWTKSKAGKVAALRNYVAKQAGARFKLVWARPPKPTDVSIKGLEEELIQLLSDRVGLTDAADVASQVNFEGLLEWSLDAVHVRPGEIEARGSGTAEFELIYGSGGGDHGMTSSDSYPFTFALLLDTELKVAEILSLEVDASSFYE